MFWVIINILITLYILSSLSTIKHQLRVISKHLSIKEEEIEIVSDEEIEKELEDELKN